MTSARELFDSQGFVIVILTALGIVGLALRSRCSTTRCCYGMVDITRNVEVELQERRLELQHKGLNRIQTQQNLTNSTIV